MSVEQKIKELLNRTGDKQQLAEESSENLAAGGMADTGNKAAANMKKDTSKASQAANAGDTSQPKQGSSKEASFSTHDEDDENQGAKAAAAVSKSPSPDMKGDAKSVKVPAMEETEQDEETVSEDETLDVSSQLNSIFGEELSEDFKAKATSIFEAAVIARVNSEMEKVTTKLEEQAVTQFEEFKASLVEKVDSYLNYVVEQWMEENQLAVESGLRVEIAEDFIEGMKVLFKEHYIEVPEEKYNVMEELQSTKEELEAQLSEAIELNHATSKELSKLKADKIFEEQTKNLAATDVEKLKKLVEGVDFDTEDLYCEKIKVIKENYFPKTQKSSPEKVLVEETGTNPAAFENSSMTSYVNAISRSIKAR